MRLARRVDVSRRRFRNRGFRALERGRLAGLRVNVQPLVVTVVAVVVPGVPACGVPVRDV